MSRMNKTNIEWVKNPDGTQGYTWNPITGCLNGCPYCYARRLANGRLRQRYLANPYIPRYEYEPFDVLDDHEKGRKLKALNDPFYPRFWEERLGNMLGKTKGKIWPENTYGIFVCDMGELFGDWIPREWQDQIFEAIKQRPRHRFYLLTKQPQNLVKWSPFPQNCWVGVTVTDAKYMADAVANLAVIEAKVKYMSFEPLLRTVMPEGLINFLDWLIIGACTGTYSEMWHLAGRLYSGEELNFVRAMRILEFNKRYTLQPKIEWVEEIVKAADRAGIPVFLKENLMPLFDFPMPGLFKKKFPAGRLELRQEMPGLERLKG